MKKVRCAIGMVAGIAPALGLMTPAANAAAAVTYAPHKSVKTVSMWHSGMTPGTTRCTGTGSKSVPGPGSHSLHNVDVEVAGRCVLAAGGSIYLSGSPQPVHFMRTRVFSAHGAMVFSGRVDSSYSSGRVFFSQAVGVKGHKVCETVFKASHPHKPVAGPVCETI